jgi:hypothetical protein
MSNAGLSANTFRVTGKYLDLLNDLIVKAKLHQELTEPTKDQLIEFIGRIVDHKNIQPQFQLLSSIIERELRGADKQPVVFFNGLLDEIKNDDVVGMLPKIEFIAGALDTENSDALSKIIGE